MIKNQQTEQIQEKKKPVSLDYFVLNYMYHHPNIPFNPATLHFVLRNTGYKRNYLDVLLSNLRRKGFLFEPTRGIFIMTTKTFLKIKREKPDFAKQIILKSDYVEEW